MSKPEDYPRPSVTVDLVIFTTANHDGSVKTFLGRTGNFKGEDIIDIILQQPACSHFMARKLYRWRGQMIHEI